MSEKKFNIGLAVFIAIVSTTLLVGARIDVDAHSVARVGETEYRRGETIRSNDETIVVEFGDAEIWLDENTEIKLIDGREDSLIVNVVEGRVVTKGAITLSVREVGAYSEGVMSFVHYSWQNAIDVASADGSPAVLAWPDGGTVFTVGIRASTLPPYQTEDIDFAPEQSSASAFYEQALK